MINIFTLLGIGIYIITFLVDRLLHHIPDIIYIPIVIIGLVLILIGYFKYKKESNNE